MIIDHIQFDLYQKKVFERMVAVPPLKIKEMFDNEACFLYMISGEQEVNSPVEHRRLNSREAVLMKCGMHFSELLKSEKTEHYEAIAVHLYPEVLKKIYDKEFPEFITSTQANLKKPESN